MIFDFNDVRENSERPSYDVCIVGAGVAGITLALGLARAGRRVLLLEAGGTERTVESQRVYRGRNVGRSYFRLHNARLRFLGGSSNHWSGWCRPLDEWDFAVRDHIENSGWPIAKSDIDPYLSRAADILEIPGAFEDIGLAGSADQFREIRFNNSSPVRFGEKYHRQLADSRSIDLFLNANLVDMRLSEDGRRVASVECADYNEPARRARFSAVLFVLAMGGIENARLMLNFRDQNPAGIGNENDLVGRYFMEHPHALAGYYVTQRDAWRFENRHTFIAPTRGFLDAQKIGNVTLILDSIRDADDVEGSFAWAKQNLVCAQDFVREFVESFYDLSCGRYFTGGYIRVMSEQVPNRRSKVSLYKRVDRFGLKRAKLDWQIADIDRDTIEKAMMGFGAYLARNELGNVKIADWLRDEGQTVPPVAETEWLGAGWHHMGTTRMSSEPSQGVVDADCRVHSLDNLYIAGSSVFPTGGFANPTLTIVQLTLRLSAHLKAELNARPARIHETPLLID